MTPTITPGQPAPCPQKMKRGQCNSNPSLSALISHLSSLPPASMENIILNGYNWPTVYATAKRLGMDIVTRKVHNGLRVWRVR